MNRFARHYVLATAVFALTVASLATAGGVASIADAAVTSVVAELNSRSQLAAAAVASSPCTIVGSTTPATNRKVLLTLSGCSGVARFQVSESPNFMQDAGVSVAIANVATDKSYADLKITYANGTTGGNGTPYSIPKEQRTIRALAVLFQYEDASGNVAGAGSYETPLWLNRLIFGDGVKGYDGFNLYNSYKDHIFQSTNGRVILSGQTYPKIVRIPLEKFRLFLTQPAPAVKDEIIAAIKRDDPNFFANNAYEHYFFISSDTYAVNRGIWDNHVDHVVFASPMDKSKSILANTIEEARTAQGTTTVVTRYNTGSVEGVWLQSDAAKTGTNYFKGGTIVDYKGVGDYYYIKLGTPLPVPNIAVVVRYKALNGATIASSTPDTQGDGWIQVAFHENYHIVSTLPQMKFSQKSGVGDFYWTPAVVPGYDVMALGAEIIDPLGNTVTPAPLLNIFNKVSMGYVTPYTLRFNENETNLRLAKAEFTDVSSIATTTAIKIPLRPAGDPGLVTKNGGHYINVDGNPVPNSKSSTQYSGEDYLLLEWRTKAPLGSGHYNFDNGIPSEGLIAYRVIDPSAYGFTTSAKDVVEQLDATPPFLGGFNNIPGSYAAFGADSNSYQFTVPELWQEKILANDTHQFEYLLSAGSGVKTLYARFVDAKGVVLGTQTLQLLLTDERTPAERLPQMTSNITKFYTLTGRRLDVTYSTPNGAASLRFYRDSTLVREDINLSGATGSTVYLFNDDQITPGTHIFKVVLYDKGKFSVTNTVSYTTLNASDVTAPVTSITAPLDGSVLSGATTITASASDNVGVTKVEFYQDAATYSFAISSTSPYAAHVAPLSIGTHTFMTKAYDAAGNTATSSTITIIVPDTTAPSVPQNLVGVAVSTNQITLTWSTSSDNIQTTGYRIYRSTGSSINTSATSFSLTGLATSTSYSYAVAAYDAAGNLSASSATTTVTTLFAPDTALTVKVLTPTNGSIVPLYSNLSINVTASDNVKLSTIRIYVDNVLKSTIPVSSLYSSVGTSWSTYTLQPGSMHTIIATAVDSLGYAATSTAVVVSASTDVDITPPAVTITTPLNSAKVTSPLIVSAISSDAHGIFSIRILVDNAQRGACSNAFYTVTTCSTGNFTLTSGVHTISAIAKDGAGNYATTSIQVSQ